MADIRPFCGVHYKQSLVKDLSAVICPPYDIITPQMQPELYHQSEYNFVRLEFSRGLPQDTATDNKYTRSAATLEQWLKQGILEVDETPAIYLHDHYFTFQGKEYRSLYEGGEISCVREASSPSDSPYSGLIMRGRLRGASAPLSNTSPSPFRERG